MANEATLQDILQAINNLANNPQTQSKDLDMLYAALAAAQSEFSVAGFNSTNPYFSRKYADFAALVQASRGPLTKNSLSVLQQIRTNDDGQSILHTRLGHASGQWIETQVRITPPKNDIQSFGSYLETLKRHSYASLVGIVAKDDDDDGEVAMIDSRKILAKGPSKKYNPKEQSYETITKEQLDEIEYELGEYLDIAEEIMDGYKIQSLADLPANKFRTAITRIREIIAVRDGKE